MNQENDMSAINDVETVEDVARVLNSPLWSPEKSEALKRLAALVRSLLPTPEVAEAMEYFNSGIHGDCPDNCGKCDAMKEILYHFLTALDSE
jgi:hypothetical protein